MKKDFEEDLTFVIASKLEKHLGPIFKANVRLTLIARTPGEPERDILVTNDELEELTQLLERSKRREPIGTRQGG